jgi:tellurite resistance protein
LLAQALRTLFSFQDIKKEWDDLSTISLFATITISGGLAAAVLFPYSRTMAELIWLPSVAIQFYIFITLLSRLVSAQTDVNSVSLVWLFPITGNAMMVLAGVPLGYTEISWFLLGVTSISWLGLLPFFLQKLLFAVQKIPTAAAPSYMILVSTPAIIAVAFYTIVGGTNSAITLVTYASLFFAILAIRLRKWLFSAPFSRAWWAFTFPVAALSSALLRHHEYTKTPTSFALSYLMLAIATFAVASIWALNIKALAFDKK